MSEIIDCIAWIVQKTCWSFYICLKFLLLRFLDLLGFVFNVAACLTFIRFPMMVKQFSDMDNLEEWRYVGLLQLLIFIADIPVMIAGAILVLTVFRMFPLCKELKEENCKWDCEDESGGIYYAGWKPRRIILKHFCLLLIDALFIPAALLCLISWRCVIFVRAFKAAPDSWEKRKTCFKQLLYLFIDIPCIIIGIFCMCTWRLPFIIHRSYRIHSSSTENWEWDKEKYNALIQFMLFLCDIPCLVCFFISSVTWRFPIIMRRLLKMSIFYDDDQWKARRLAIVQFALLFVDIPCILCAFFVFVTIWRFPCFIQDFKSAVKKKKGRQWKIRKSAVVQFGTLIVDIGCFILILLITATLWRTYPLMRSIKMILRTTREKGAKGIQGNSKGEIEDDSSIPAGSGDDRDGEIKASESGHAEGINLEVDSMFDNSQSGTNVKEGDEEEVNERKDPGIQDLEIKNPDFESGEGDSGTSKKKKKFGWKIRKAICMQFVGLLLDLPALVLLVFLIVTILRVPRLLSTFLQSGDFYTEFAITVYYQTYILFIDIIFSVIFLLLMFLRPVQSWICLLEDEDHMKYRLLCHHMQWIPDIVAKREINYQNSEELLSVHLKMFSQPFNFRVSVNKVLNNYTNELKAIRDKLKADDLDADYIHLLDTVLWWEDKRVDKLLRRYNCEYNYLFRPDTEIHKQNLEKLQREFEWFECKVEEQYCHLKEYKPQKVPLWAVKTGLSTRTRKETQKVLINCLPRGNIFLMLLALLCCVPIYRAPKLFKDLWNRWYDRANIILHTLKEYGLDLVAVLRITLVIVFIYRAPFLIADISIDIIDKKSWKAVRRTAKRYPVYIWEDCIDLIKTLFSWKTPRFVFTALLFSVLMPADMFLTATKLFVKNTCILYTITGTLYFIFIGFPFVYAFYLGKKLLDIGIGWVSAGACCAFVGALLLVLAFMVVGYVKNSKETQLVPRILDYFHWNWYNIHIVIMELLEFLQLIALVFSFSNIPMYGGNVLHKVSNYLLLSFFSFEFKLWLAFSLFIIWFFLSAAPIIFEQILEDLPKGTCEKHSGWRMAISLFANTLFITFVESFSTFFSCSYTKCPSDISYKLLLSNSTCLKAYLTDDHSIECWIGQHRVIALFGLFALVWYTSTSFLVGIQYGDPGIKKQDVEFSPTYNIVSNFIKAAMIVAVVVITTNKYAVLGILIVGNTFMILFTLLFKCFFHYKPTNSVSFLSWRVASFSSSVSAAIAVVIAYAVNDNRSKSPLIVFASGTLVSLFFAFILSLVLRKKGNLSDTRKKFKDRLFALEKRLVQDSMLLSSWKNQCASWKNLLKRAREARRDDQLFNEADWDNLLAKEPQTDLQGEDKVEVVTAAGQGDQKESHETQATDSIASQSDEPMLSLDLPPPPSYGAMSADTVDASRVFPDISYNFSNKEEINESPFDSPLMSLERNGVNLLLVLEQSVLYKAYSFSFFAQRSVWLSSVVVSNWTGLLHCLDVLESNLDFSFDRPSPLDMAVGGKSLSTDVLEEDQRDSDHPPAYTPESRDPAVIEANSIEQRNQALTDIESVGDHGCRWRELMDKVLPTLPIIRSWTYERDTGNFTINLRRSVTGKIKAVGPNGIKLARGANFSLGKITKGNLSAEKIAFAEGCQPRGSKGPVQLNIADIGFIWKKGMWYLESQGKSVKYSVALDSMQEIEWR